MKIFTWTILLSVALITMACGSSTSENDDGASDADSDTDTDTDSDTDTDTDTDSDGDTETVPLTFCDKAIEMTPYVKTEHATWSSGYELPNEYDLSLPTSCFRENCLCHSEPNHEACIDDAGLTACAADGPELVFKGFMEVGQRFVLDKASGSNYSDLKRLEECEETTECIFSHNYRLGENEFIATEAGEHYFAIEFHAGGAYFNTTAGIFDDSETDCADGLDNDGNGLIDCLDLDCDSQCASQASYLLPRTTFDTQLDPTWEASAGGWAWGNSPSSFSREILCDSEGGRMKFQDDTNLNSGVYLKSPVIDVSTSNKVALGFAQALQIESSKVAPSYYEVQILVDGAGEWTPMLRFDKYNHNYKKVHNGFEVVDLSEHLSGATSFEFRFFYTDEGRTDWNNHYQGTAWDIDDVFVLGGDMEILGGRDSNLRRGEEVAGATGCDGAAPKCESLYGKEHGSCGEDLGYYFNGEHCVAATGCSSNGYCYFPDALSCARSCAANRECNEGSFIGNGWPTPDGYTVCMYGIKVCTTAGQHESQSNSMLNDMYDDASVDSTMTTGSNVCGDSNHKDTTHGGEFLLGSGTSGFKVLTPDTWEILCGYSLLPELTEMYCIQVTAGF